MILTTKNKIMSNQGFLISKKLIIIKIINTKIKNMGGVWCLIKRDKRDASNEVEGKNPHHLSLPSDLQMLTLVCTYVPSQNIYSFLQNMQNIVNIYLLSDFVILLLGV